MAEVKEKTPVVVFVDDEKEILEILVDLFRDSPFRVICVPTGREAVDLITQYNVRMIVCDLLLKDMSGLEVLKHYRDMLPDCRRVLMTGYLDEAQEEQARREQLFETIIPKPWDIYSLRKQIHDLMLNGGNEAWRPKSSEAGRS